MSEVVGRRRRNLRRLLAPRHIAFVGGQEVAEAIRQCEAMGFTGRIWPVNPKYAELAGQACVPSLACLPEPPDAAFVAVPRQATIEVVRELAARGAGGCICYAAGFAEVGGEGTALQRALVEVAGDLALVGPNCWGILNYVDGVAMWPSGFGGGRVERGVAMIAQSGNMALNLSMNQRSVPFAYIISAGNQAVLQFADYVDVLVEDPRAVAIGLYIEGLSDVSAFSCAAAKALTGRVPIVAIKAGQSGLGARLALSHTGSLAGEDRLYSALFERLGIIRVTSLPALLETLKLLAVAGVPPGDRLAVFTCSGGDSLMVADLATKFGLTLPEFNPAQATALRAQLPDFATVSNPLDYSTALWGDRTALTECFSTALAGGFDAGLLVIDYPEKDAGGRAACDAAVEALAAARERTGKFAAVASTLPELMPEAARRRLAEGGAVALQGLDEALAAIASAALYARRRGELTRGEGLVVPPPPSPPPKPRLLDEFDSKGRLARFGLAVPEGRLISPGAAPSAAAQLGFPVVAKLASPAVAHKTEAGAIARNLRCEADVEAAVAAMAAALARQNPPLVADRFLIERQVEGAVGELIVGVRRDDQFGLVLVVGAGGVLVELLEDLATLLLPTNRATITRAIAGLREARLLAGYRGRPAGDVEAAVNAVVAVVAFAEANRNRLVELDVNPLLVLPKGHGALAVDALIVMDPG